MNTPRELVDSINPVIQHIFGKLGIRSRKDLINRISAPQL